MARQNRGLFGRNRQPQVEAAAPVIPVESGIPGAVVAAVAGAVAMICGEGATVRSIRPVAARRTLDGGRAVWSMAGLLENTRPF